MDISQINNKWPIAKPGFPFILISLAFTILFCLIGLKFVAVLTGIITLFIIFFFRDPERTNSNEPKAVVTPADGRILEIIHLNDSNNPLGETAVKISIFMSIFNVHVNRIPVGGVIRKIVYNPGKFFSANLDKASEYNENNRVFLQTPDKHKVACIQIAGLIARRIVCWIKAGDQMETGQRFGLIRFGSRLEVFLPAASKIIAVPHQKVKAGKTIIGYLP
ncbi:MAG: phosphatidylserine decarboxylase [Desulfobacteraceae bacterium 4484_190.1]|nr:MAG: phosphatidylserine decarboxylase [Desulfobacteraceae bacterium 4484_190.1]